MNDIHILKLIKHKEGLERMIYELEVQLNKVNKEIETYENTKYGELKLEERRIKVNDYTFDFIFLENYVEIDRFMIGRIDHKNGWVTLVDNYGEAYNIKMENNDLYVKMNDTGNLLIHVNVLKEHKSFTISLKSDGVPRRKLRGFEVDLVKVYCKHSTFQINSKEHTDFQRFLKSFQDRN